MFPSPDAVIDSRYKLQEKRGEGGFAVVYKASDLELGRIVAIKFLKISEQDSENIQRFLREAKLIASVKHPNIVSVYSVDFLESQNVPYIVMEYLEGECLASKVNRGGPLTSNEFMALFPPLCDALAYLHEHNIIHRDLSANNIFLSSVSDNQIGDPKIIDFGLSKSLANNSTENDKKLTATGVLLGNPAYMSPEQVRGEKLDQRSDIYSLACVFYTVLYGHPPFEADNSVALMYKHQSENPTFPNLAWKDGRLANNVIASLRTALSKDSAKRFQSCSEFAASLQNGSDSSVQSKQIPGRSLIGSAIFLMILLVCSFGFRNSTTNSIELGNKTKNSITRLNRAVPKTFEELLEANDRLKDAGKKREALDILLAFKGLKNLTVEEQQIIELRKLFSYGQLGLREDADRTARNLYENTTANKSAIVTVGLMQYLLLNEPEKAVALSEKWRKLNEGEENVLVDLTTLRALVCARRFEEAGKMIPTFESYELRLHPTTYDKASEVEQLKLVVKVAKNQVKDVVAAAEKIHETIPRDRLFSKSSNYAEVADCLDQAGFFEQAIKLWFAAVNECDRSDHTRILYYLGQIVYLPEHQKKYPEEVMVACERGIALNFGSQQNLMFNNILVRVLLFQHRFADAEKIAIRNFDAIVSTLTAKETWTLADCKAFADVYGQLIWVAHDEAKEDEFRKYREVALNLVSKHKEAGMLRAGLLLFAAGDFGRKAQSDNLMANATEAANQLDALRGEQDFDMFSAEVRDLSVIVESYLPTNFCLHCLECIKRSYSNLFPERDLPLLPLALLSQTYSAKSQKEPLKDLFTVVVKSLKNFNYVPNYQCAFSTISLVRVYARTDNANELKSELLKLTRNKSSATVEAINLLALSEYYLDSNQLDRVESLRPELRTKMMLVKRDSEAYEELRRAALIVAIRTPGEPSKAFVRQLLDGLKTKQRLEIYLSLSNYSEIFYDYSTCANFLAEHIKEVEGCDDSSVFTLYRVMGDCFFSISHFSQAEKAYGDGLKLLIAKKPSVNNGISRDLATSLALWCLIKAQYAQSKYSEALQGFRKLNPSPDILKILDPVSRKHFLVDWKISASKCGTKDDLQHIEKFEQQLASEK